MKSLRKLLEANGFAATSAPPAVNELIRNGHAVKVAEGIYAAKT